MCLAAVTFIVFLVQTIRLAPATHIVLESLFFQCRLCVWHSLHLLFFRCRLCVWQLHWFCGNRNHKTMSFIWGSTNHRLKDEYTITVCSSKSRSSETELRGVPPIVLEWAAGATLGKWVRLSHVRRQSPTSPLADNGMWWRSISWRWTEREACFNIAKSAHFGTSM